MSSHREAPEISKDPVADNTDTYAFVSPDQPDTVTIITNYIPLEDPAGGPNFFEFGDDVLYSIYIDNDGDARPDITYQFRFDSQLRNPNTFLYNTGPINSLDDPNWNKRQFYDVTKVISSTSRPCPTAASATVWPSPPCNIGPRSTPNYATLAAGGRAHAADRGDGLRRPAERRLLRRPRCDLRPRRPPSVPEPAPDPVGRGGERRPARDAERAHDRDADPDQEPDQGRDEADGRDELEVGARHLGRGEPPVGPDHRRRRRRAVAASVRGPRCRASAIRCSTR